MILRYMNGIDLDVKVTKMRGHRRKLSEMCQHLSERSKCGWNYMVYIMVNRATHRSTSFTLGNGGWGIALRYRRRRIKRFRGVGGTLRNIMKSRGWWDILYLCVGRWARGEGVWRYVLYLQGKFIGHKERQTEDILGVCQT